MKTSLDKVIKEIINNRKSKKSKSESLASLEEALFVAEKDGNKRKQDAIKAMIKKIKKI